MARVKPQAAPRKFDSPRSKPASGWAWLFAGIVLGLLAALMINTATKRSDANSQAISERGNTESSRAATKEPAIPPLPPMEKNDRFTFYQSLKAPDTFVVPKEPTRPLPTEATKPTVPLERPTPSRITPPSAPARANPIQAQRQATDYLLMIGSFRNPQRANNLKEQLNAMGLSASISRGKSATNDIMHRVHIGPLGLPEANRLQQRLQQKRIASIILRASG